jgi:hypothetical protein
MVLPNSTTIIDSNYVPPLIINGTPYYDSLSFTVELTSFNGCDSTVILNFYPLTGTRQPISEQEVRLYPNPTTGQFFIETKNGSPVEIEILDGVGQVVFCDKTSPHQPIKNDLGHLPNGVYWVKIMLPNSVVVRRLVLMK